MIPEAEWVPLSSARGRHMGAPALHSTENLPHDVEWWLGEGGDPERPIETYEDGCPGSWYRCEFFSSVIRYTRPVSGDGVYSPNILLDRCHDELIIEAVHYYEQEQARARRWYYEQEADIRARSRQNG